MAMIPVYNWQTRQIEFVDDGQNAGGQAQQQQQPGGAGGIANIGGMAAGRYVGNSILGGGSAAASAPIATAAGSSPLTSALGGAPVATALDGGTLTTMSPQVVPGAGAPGLGFAPYAGIGAAAYGAYGLNKAIKSGSVKSGALSGASLGGGLAAAAPILFGTGPVGLGVIGLAALGGGLGGGAATKLLHHESTRDFARKNTEDLFSQGQNDPRWQNYVAGMREQYNSAPPDPSKPFFNGKYAKWSEYKAAGLDAGDLSGVLGNLQTFGPDWAGYSDEQRKKITQGLIDADLYKNKKGEVVVTDQDRARQIRDEILSGKKKEEAKSASDPLSLDGFNSKFGNSWNQARGGG